MVENLKMRLEEQSQHLVESKAFPKSVLDELPPESSEISHSLLEIEKNETDKKTE